MAMDSVHSAPASVALEVWRRRPLHPLNPGTAALSPRQAAEWRKARGEGRKELTGKMSSVGFAPSTCPSCREPVLLHRTRVQPAPPSCGPASAWRARKGSLFQGHVLSVCSLASSSVSASKDLQRQGFPDNSFSSSQLDFDSH